MRVAVVLGAGGSAGWAFHLGVARAIEHTFQRSLADVDLVVGTSAGGAIGSTLRIGATVDQALTSVTTPPTANERAAMREASTGGRSGFRRFLPLAPGLVVRGLVQPRRVGLVMAGALPSGVFPTIGLSRLPNIDQATDWPDGLWLPAVRVADGKVVVFGRDRTDVSLADAMEASSAVPGMFRPKEIDGELFVDGATASSNHADLASEIEPDVVVVSSVQTRPGRRASRILARRQLPAELRRLESTGTEIVVIEPDAAISDLIDGFPRRTGDQGPQIVDGVAAFAKAALSAGGDR